MRFVLLTLFCLSTLFAESSSEGLSQLSLNERALLREFFRRGIEIQHLGYVLFFDTKPMCMYPISFKKDRSYRDKTIAKGWQVWKEHEALFPHEKFLICEEESPFSSEILHVYVINKSMLRRCINNHLDEFVRVLGDGFSPDTFILEIENSKKIRSHICNDEMLLGILFGYGKESAQSCKLYKQDQKSIDADILLQAVPVIPQDRVITKGKNGVHVKGAGISAVRWSGNPNSSEVQSLVSQYEDERSRLKRLFRRKDFLKISLEKLCE